MAYTEILSNRAGLRDQLYTKDNLTLHRQNEIDAAGSFGRGWKSSGLSEEAGYLMDQANNAYRAGDKGLGQALELQGRDKMTQAQQWAPTVQNFTDINSVGSAVDWATGSLGQGLRSTLPSIAGGLVGAGLGAVAAPFTFGTINPLTGARIGSALGAAIPGYNMEANETIASAMVDPEIRANKSMQEIKDTGRMKGVAAGALEAVVPAMMVGKAAGLAGRVAKGDRLAAIGKSAGQGALTEFATEGAQDISGQIAENSLKDKALTDIDPKQAFNAGMAGAISGGGMGAMGGAAQVATSALGAGVDRAKDVAGNPVGEAVGRLSAKKTEREILKATGEDERIMDDPNSTPEQRREAALRYAAQLDKDPTATAEEKEIARKYANSPEVFADSLYIHRREKEQNDAHDAIINELNGGKKKSLMRGTLTDDFGEQEGRDSLDDIVTDDQGKVVLGEHGHPMKREVKDGYGGATMITAQPGATQPVPGNEVSAPNTTLAKKTRAEEVASAKQAVSAYNTIDKAAAAQIGTFHQPEQDGVKSQNTERLADAAEIWRKQGISDKLISATSGVTDAKQREMSMAMLRYVSKGLKGDDGNVFVPESLVEVYGEKAGTMINSAAQVAVVKGLADPSILNDAKHAQKIADDMHKQNKDVFSAVRDNMLDAAKKIYSDKDVAKFVPEMRRMAQEGTTKSEEAFLMRLYGSKEAIAAAMSKFKEKTKTPKQAEATARADDGYDGDDGDEDLDYEDKLASANKGSHDSGYAFRGRGKDPKHENYNAPFDLQNDYHIKELSEALGGTDAFTKENGVYGVVSAVREQFEGEELHDAENALIDKHGYDFLSDSQKSAMEEYGDGLPVSDLVNELPDQARKAILDKINKRFVMYSPAQTDSAAPADKVYSISALENKNVDPRVAPWVEEVKGKDGKTFKIHHIGGTVDSGVLYLEKVGVKTPFKTTVMDILRHTNKANAVENPHGVSKGVGAHESMQALFQGLSALFETGKFTGRIGYKTEITEADKKEPFASVKWVEDFDKLPGELKLGARTLADARKAESEALASGDGKASHKYQPEFAASAKGKRSALEKVFDTIEAEIEAFVKEAVEQIETKTIARFKAYAKKKGWSDSWVKGQKGREILDGWIKNDTAKVEAESRKKAQDRIAFRLDEMVGGNIFVVETVDDNGDLKRIPQNPIDALNSVLYSPSTKRLNKVYTALRNSWRSTADALVGGGSTIGTTPISQRKKAARTTVDPNNVTGDHKRNRKTPRTDAEQWISEDKEQMTASEGDATRDVQEHAGSIRDADPTTEFYRTERGWIKGDDTNPGMVEGNSRGGDRLPTGTAARSANDSTSQAMHPKDDERQMAAKVKLGAAQLADEAAVTHLRQGVPHAVKVGADMRNATDKKSKSALVAYTQALNRIAHSTAKQISKDFAHLLTNSGKEMTEGVARSIIQRAKTTLEGLGGKEIEGVVGLTKGDGRSAAQRDTPVQSGKVKLPGDSKYTPKDQAKSDKANKFIGRGSAASDTAKYAAAWGNLANTGTYSSSDTVFISAEGDRSGRVDPDFKEIKKAIDAGATLITDNSYHRGRNHNVGERQVAEFLQNNGYAEVGPGVWKKLSSENRLIEGFENNRDSKRSEVSILIDELKSLLDDTEVGPFGRHRFVYNKDHQPPKELAEFIEHLAAIERGLNGATPKQEKAVSEMLTKVYRAFEHWSGQHVVDAVEGGDTNTPPKGAIDPATTNPDTPVWGVVTPKDEDGVGELLAAFKDIGRASTYAEQVGGNLVNDLLKNLVGKSKNRDGNTSDTDSAQKIIQETDEDTVVFDGKTYSTNNQKEMDALDAAITEYVKRGHKEAMEVFSNVNDVYPYEGAFKDAGYKIDDNGDLVEADTGEKIYKPSVYNPNQQTMFSKQNAEASKGATKEETDAVREQILKTVGPDTDVMFHESFPDGSSGVFTPDEQRDLIEISLHSDVAGTGFHEAMHKFFKILRKHGGPAAQNLLERVAQRGVVMKQLEVLLHDHPEAWAQAKSDPEEAAAFMYQFWKKGLLNIGPETKTVFQKIAKLFNRVFRRLSAEVRDEIAAEKMMRAFSSGQFADPAVREAAVAALQKRTEQHDAALKAIGEGYRKFATGVGRLAYTSQGVLESSNNKYFKEIGNWFNQQAGTVLQKFGNNNAGSYFDAVHSIHNYFNNRFENIVEGLSKPELEIVRKALANGTDSHIDRIQRVIEQMRSFNDEMGRYMEARNIERLTSSGWEKVRMRKDFGMPQVWDREKVAENKADVVKLLMEHHFDELAKIASQAEVEIAGGGKQGDAAKRAVKENSAVTPQMVAEAIVDNMAQSGQIEMTETGSDLGITPFAASVNKRSLDWISNKVFDDYKSKDLFNAYTTYIAGMVKRGEYTVRFGRDGDRIRDNVERGYADMLGGVDLHKAAERNYNEAMETWREAVKQDGKDRLPEPSMMKIIESTYKEINGDTDEVKAKIKSVNKSIAQYQKAIMGLEGTLGADISEAHRTINSALVTYQSVRLLSASLFTSLNDVIGIVAAGGTLSDAWEGFVTGIKEAKMLAWNNKKSTNELAKNAEMWGTVEGMAYNDTLGQMYASQYMTGRFKTISDTFFRRIGMEGWNRGMRMVASKVGDRIITDWANGKINMKDPAEAARFKHLFGEGVSPSDIKLKEDGTLDKSDFLNRAAMARFVNDAVLRPNAAHRTIWGNDTRFAPLWSLKSYTYSFHKVIIESAIKQAGLGNYRPVMALVAGYAPIAIAAGAIKEMLMPGDEPPWMKSGLGGYLSYGFDRANLLGIPQMYAGSLIPGSRFDPANVFGPTVDQIQGFASIPFLQDKTLLGESAGAMPFGNVARRIVGE